ncbi:hypothetical protein REPUB_Repub03eG0164400 [Reevesia pubescens]
MDDEEATSQTSLLLGRPFMKMTKTKIDVFKRSLTMEVNDKVTNFFFFLSLMRRKHLLAFLLTCLSIFFKV